MSGIVELGPHDNMTVEECLDYCARNRDEFEDVIVLGVDKQGHVVMRSSAISREWMTFLLLEAIDKARGVS